MSLASFLDWPYPFELNGEITTEADVDVSGNVQVSGTLIGTGIDTDRLDKANAWTGLNTYTNTASITATDTFEDEGIGKVNEVQIYCDSLAAGLQSTESETFTGELDFAGTTAETTTVGASVGDNAFVSYDDANTIINNELGILNDDNVFTGSNTFSNIIDTSSNIPVVEDDDQVATKKYTDAKVASASKVLTFTYDQPGEYTINTSLSTVIGIDYKLWGAGVDYSAPPTATYKSCGSFVGGSLANAMGTNSINIHIADGTQNNLTDEPDDSYIKINNVEVVRAGSSWVATTGTLSYGAGSYNTDIYAKGDDAKPPAVENPHEDSILYWRNADGECLWNCYKTGDNVELGVAGTQTGGAYFRIWIEGGLELSPN